jgi:hypothetical protein
MPRTCTVANSYLKTATFDTNFFRMFYQANTKQGFKIKTKNVSIINMITTRYQTCTYNISLNFLIKN